MTSINPTEIRSLAAKYGCTIRPPTVEAAKPKKSRPGNYKRRNEGKNITVARKWIAERQGEFTHQTLAAATGLKKDAAKYIVWKLALQKEIVAQPRGEFENQQHFRRYVKA